jgi:hypothetical protein
MAMHVDEPLPSFAIVGHEGTALWADAAIGFVTFYHRVFKNADGVDAVAAMRAAAGDDGFHILFGAHAQQAWTHTIERERAAILEALENLQPTAPAGGDGQMPAG